MALINDKYYNRDLSWLRFNHRVLQEAADERNPLYERIRFLAIFSSNLDEFFRVRVSDIRQIKQLDKKLRKKLITKPNKLLRIIKEQVTLQQEEFGRIYKQQIIPALQQEGIYIFDHTEYDDTLQEEAIKYYDHQLKADLAIVRARLQHPEQLFVENETLYLVALKSETDLIWVKIPSDTTRLVVLQQQKDQHLLTFVDDILRYNLALEFDTDFYAIKVSRDAGLYIDNEYSGNLLDKIVEALDHRDTGQVTRMLIDSDMPPELLEKLKITLDVTETDIVKGGKYHNLRDFFTFPNLTGKDLSFRPLPPIPQEALQAYDSMFDAVRSRDRLLYFPYESFKDIIRWVEEAAGDPEVTKIKMTLYRISKNSAVAKALLKAAANGKKVYVFIETKARFDEANNIKWGKRLEEQGAKVQYSYPGIKVHSKIMYMERLEGKKTQSYGYIGTGNFNEKTATIYSDMALLTARDNITRELLQVFRVLEGKLIIPKTEQLLVSPFSTRTRFKKLIEKEIKNARAGKEAYMILKMNSLQDTEMIQLLYRASRAGVHIRLLVRGICCLVPGVEGQSENITVTSIVDRFLEHTRVFIFANGGKEKMYIGSADWMTRNLDHRIEVVTPILDEDLAAKIRRAMQLQLDDSVKARIIDAQQNNHYVAKGPGELSAQHLTYEKLFSLAES